MTSEETGGHLCARRAEVLRYGLQELCAVLVEEKGATDWEIDTEVDSTGAVGSSPEGSPHCRRGRVME